MKPAKYSVDDIIQEGVLAFLYAEKEFMEGRGASFKTYLTRCLRNHFINLIRQTYRNKEVSDYPSLEEVNSVNKKATPLDTLEIVQTSFIIESFSDNELEYVNAILSLTHKARGGRRKTARRNLGISYEREVELRNSIRDKIRK